MSAKKTPSTIPPEIVALYDQLIATNPAVQRKGATMPYTSLNGNMFSYLGKDGILGLRLPKQIREDFLAKYQTTLVEAYGIVQKEYVAVPEDLLRDTQELKPYFELSFEHAMSLKPKPMKKNTPTNT